MLIARIPRQTSPSYASGIDGILSRGSPSIAVPPLTKGRCVMRAFLAAVVLTLMPSSLSAAPFEFPDYGNTEGFEDHKTLA